MWGTLSSFLVVVCHVATECGAFGTAALSDETVFVQQRQLTHQHLDNRREIEEAAQSLLKSVKKLHLSQSPVSERAEQGVSVNEISVEPGGHVVFLLGPGCNATDMYGSNNCTLTWSHKARLLWGVHAPSLLHQEDEAVLKVTWALRAENVSSAAARYFTGTRFRSTGSCTLCNGACWLRLWAEDDSLTLNFEAPMQLLVPSMCFALRVGVPIADLKITDWTMELPAGPPSSWRLGGEGTASLALRNASGVDMLRQNITVGLSPSPLSLPRSPSLASSSRSASFSPSASLSSSLGLAASPALLMRDAQGPQQSMGFLQALLALHRASLAGAAEAIASTGDAAQFRRLREDARSERGAAKTKHLVLEYRLKMFELGDSPSRNFSVRFEPGCTAGGSNLTSCRLPFGEPVKLHLSMNLGAYIEEGSVATVTAEPRLTGMLGVLFGSLLSPVKTQLPLCGEPTTVSLGLLHFPYQPGECGRYAFTAKVPSLEFALPNIENLTLRDLGVASGALPMLPNKLVDLPGVSLRTALLLQHSDGKRIADVEFELGFER